MGVKKNEKNAKMQTILVVLIIFSFIVSLVFMCMKETGYFTDFTNAYYLHNEVSSLDSLEATIKYFDDNRIPYKVKDGTLSAENGKLTYTINEDNCKTELVPSDDILIFSKLDDGDCFEVTTITKKVKGKYVKEFSYAANDKTYYKQGNKYYTNDSTSFTAAALSCAGINLLSILIYGILNAAVPTDTDESEED